MSIRWHVSVKTLVKPSFVIFDFQALWRSELSVRVPGCQKLQINPVWQRMLYSCAHMATIGHQRVERLTESHYKLLAASCTETIQIRLLLVVSVVLRRWTGLVQLVMESDTLRCIQVKGHGLAGSFKDSTIVEWLQVHNPTELDYRKVSSSNFYNVHRFLITGGLGSKRGIAL